MSIMFGTVSYLPDNDIRHIRKERAIQTFKCYGNLAKHCGKILHVVTTCWRDEEWNEVIDILSSDGISVNRIICTTLGAGFAKSILYDLFYESDCDFLFTGDDDMIVYPYYDFERCLREVDDSPNKFLDSKVYFFTCIRSNLVPYKESNMRDIDFCNNWIFLYKAIGALGYPFVLCNTKKYIGKEIRPIFEGRSFGFREDLSFAAELLKLGIIPYTLTAFIATTYSREMFDSAIHSDFGYATNQQKYIKELNKEFLELYPKAFINKVTGWSDISPYLPYRFNSRVTILRSVPYTFQQKDMVVKRNKKIPKINLLNN